MYIVVSKYVLHCEYFLVLSLSMQFWNLEPPELQSSLSMHQGRHRKSKRTRRCPYKYIRTPHGKGHTKIACPHFQKEVPTHVGNIDKYIRRKDLALAQDMTNTLERVGRSSQWLCGRRGIAPDFSILVVAGIVKSVSWDNQSAISFSNWFPDFSNNVDCSPYVYDTIYGVREQPGIASIEVIVRVPMEI